MKRILLIVAILVMATPALATVSVTAVGEGSGVFRVSYNCDGGEEVRAFALDINVGGSATIDAIYDFNVGDNNGYGVFPGKFRDYINATTPNWADPCYNPVAPTGDPDAGTGLGTNSITIEMGSLYETTAPPASGTLFRLDVNCNGGPDTDLAIVAESTTRGGVIDEDGDAVAVAPASTPVPCELPPCFPTGPTYALQYADWDALRRPDCWCGIYSTDPDRWKYQCDGDAAGGQYLTTGWLVYSDDVGVVTTNWRKKATDTTINACADVTHKQYLTTGWRVYSDDVGVISTNWRKKATDTAYMQGNCPRPD